jgi:hypothetical protein
MRISALIAAAVLLAACSKQAPAPATAHKAATPPPPALPKFKGTATANKVETDIAITADGVWTVSFIDSLGSDIPAAVMKNVTLESAGAKIPLAINDTGEGWTGKGALPQVTAKAQVGFVYEAQPASVEIGLELANVPLDYVCPMDPDVRSPSPGNCSRCGMKLVLGVPDAEEYPLDMAVSPAQFHAGDKVRIDLEVHDPKTGKKVTKFETVHERLFHLFIVGSDLQYFVHDHPKADGKGGFAYQTAFPKPGMYRLLGDYYPSSGSPQLEPRTVFVPGAAGEAVNFGEAKLVADMAPQKGANTGVAMRLEPARPAAGGPSRLFLTLDSGEKLQKYLGAWAHMLAASDDLIDMLHEHPANAAGGPEMEFDLTFPRARTYRIWVQFQRAGVVNTVAFNVPVQ